MPNILSTGAFRSKESEGSFPLLFHPKVSNQPILQRPLTSKVSLPMEERTIITATFSSAYSKALWPVCFIMSMKPKYPNHHNNTSKREDVCCKAAAYSEKQSRWLRPGADWKMGKKKAKKPLPSPALPVWGGCRGILAPQLCPEQPERSEIFQMKIHRGEAFTACPVPEFLILFTLVLIPTQVGVTEVRGQTQTFCLELFNLPSFIFCAKPLLKLHEGTISAFWRIQPGQVFWGAEHTKPSYLLLFPALQN